MDKSFVKKHNLSEAVKRFQQINEYNFYESSVLAEDGDEDQQQNDGQMPPMDNGMDGQPAPDAPQGDNMGMNNQEPPMDNGMGADPNGMGNEGQSPVGDNSAMGGEMPPIDNGMGADPNGMEEMPPMEGGDEMDVEVETDGEGDTVIDVDDLTQSQEASEIKLDGVDDKMTELLKVLTTFGKALNANDQKIDDLRKEIEDRIPSQQEKLNIRSQASYPYSETPKKYWEDKTLSDPRYGIVHDNDVSPADELKKYEITQNDVKNINPREVADSFDLKNITLDKFLNF